MYTAFQELIAIMDAAGYDYKREIIEIEKRNKALNLCQNSGAHAAVLTLSDHVRTMVYAQLSNNRPWQPIADKQARIDEIFCGFDTTLLKCAKPEKLIEDITAERCGNRQIKKQMHALKANIETLEKIHREHGSIDSYLRTTGLADVVRDLSDPNGKYKLVTMGTALVCEYLKGVGVDVVKPDTLLCRILGRLGYATKTPATPWEAIEICQDIGKTLGLSQAMVDTVLWQYCAKDKFEVCTATPKCNMCGSKNCLRRINRK